MSLRLDDLRLPNDGAQFFRAALTDAEIAALDRLARLHDKAGPGVRLRGAPLLTQLLGPGSSLSRIADQHFEGSARAVRALLFDKTPESNWSLGWHQDRTIAVQHRIDAPGFSSWTIKSGIQHVEPPFPLISRMITLRAHLDVCDADNAPLKIVPGSHQWGRIAADDATARARGNAQVQCIALPGDVWAYVSSILHASDAAASATHRRILHVDFADFDLPGDLEWYGV